ncbi:MAG: ABC transporter permease subunit [Nocardioides sp.]|uniref:ABC transporter permease subunit n=1 Tax=Nocardioides sp. TaxID=35761 RepID=UPI003263D5BB
MTRLFTGRTGDLVAAEWIKMRSLRSTGWALLALVMVSVGLSVMATSLYMSKWSSLDQADRDHLLTDPVGLILQPTAIYGQIAVCVLGALMIASEYATGTIRVTMLAQPRRPAVLLAKATVLAGVVMVVGELIAVTSFLIGQRVLAERADVSLGDPGVLRAIIGTGLYLAAMALFSLGVGTAIRHTGTAIATILGTVLVLPPLTSLLPGRLGHYLSTYLPGEAGQQLLSVGDGSGSWVMPWQGFAALMLWALGALGVGGLLLVRRDV